MNTKIAEKDVKVEWTNAHRGIASSQSNVLTFEIQGVSERENITTREFQTLYSKYSTDRVTMRLGDYTIPFWGEGHNLYPQEVAAVVGEHKLIPKLIEKQVKFLFGKGPRLYQEQVIGEGADARRVRVPIVDSNIQNWLESWEEKGYNHHYDYIKSLATDYYLVKTCATKYNFNKGRRIGAPASIDALSYVGADEARLAAIGDFTNKRIKSEDCQFVIQGDWLYISSHQYDVFPRFDPRNPTKFPTAIAFNSEKTFTKWVYAFNDWFKGASEYIKSSNLAPKYTNSYYKNALNAHVHVIIPGEWYVQQRTTLEGICNSNLTMDPDTPIQTEYRGVRLVDDAGKPYRFFETMVDDLISCELRRITSLMTGEGKNQGKLYATTQWGETPWKFEEFPGKFKEFTDSINSNDKRSDQVVLASLGIPSAITGVDKEGVISLAGADVYYNYLLYVSTLTWDEFFVMKELNRGMNINFPYAKTKGIKIGLWIDIPAKQQDTAPKDRLTNTATADPAVK
jgi:hypothetical protein